MELSDDDWVAVATSDALRRGAVLAHGEVVVWRSASGRLCAQPRRCPHLDWDLAEARVDGEELICPGHGWSFTVDGRAGKRNERGRFDDKGTVTTRPVRERDRRIEVRTA
ncbi:MAG TPA: Rieske (2Fe-2S) protein [Acidimicrobiia bacterium]|nr:Rieske (2Fe-2S) protein [Acidimicrobiia bacterium]